MNPFDDMRSRMRICGALILAGLLIEVVSLYWSSAPAFLVFAIIGIPVLLLGILFFLYSLVSVKTRDEADVAIAQEVAHKKEEG